MSTFEKALAEAKSWPKDAWDIAYAEHKAKRAKEKIDNFEEFDEPNLDELSILEAVDKKEAAAKKPLKRKSVSTKVSKSKKPSMVKFKKTPVRKRPATAVAKKVSAKKKTKSKAVYSAYTPFADVGSKVGGALGGFFGNSGAGSSIGQYLGSSIGTLFGSGKYVGNFHNLTSNSIIQNRMDVPNVRGGGKYMQGTRIHKREFIADIISSPTANTSLLQTFNINPSIQSTFPWLSSISNSWEEYVINGMIFEFKSMSSDSLVSAQTNLGFIAMATVYDVLDVLFTSKQQLENYEFAQSAKPSCDQIHGIECKRSMSTLSELYIRPEGGLPAGADQRFYDFGVFNLMSQAPGTSVNLGELWVSYDITLLKTKLPQTASGLDTAHASRAGTTGPINFGNVQNFNVGNLAGNLAFPGSSNLLLNALTMGVNYKITMQFVANAVITTVPTFTFTLGTLLAFSTSQAGVPDVGLGAIAPSPFGITTQGVIAVFEATPTAVPAGSSNGQIAITLGGGTSAATTFGVDVWVDAIDSGVTK